MGADQLDRLLLDVMLPWPTGGTDCDEGISTGGCVGTTDVMSKTDSAGTSETRYFLRTFAFPAEVEEFAAAAEADGWDGLLFQDSQNLTPDITASMTLAARCTERLTIGTAATNLITRNPAVVASTFATLQQVSGGRALLGVARGDTALHLVGEQAPSAERFGELLDEVRTYLPGGVVRLGDAESRLS